MLNKCNSKKETIPQIDIITKWDKGRDEFYAPGALIRVKNGKNLLGAKFSEELGEATYYTLMFQGKPLFQFQGEEYYCPTLDTELYPTDGNEHLFWNVPNSDERLPGSCI